MSEPKPTDRLLIPFWRDVGKGLGVAFVGSILTMIGAGVLAITVGWPPVQQAAATAFAVSSVVLLLTVGLVTTSKVSASRAQSRAKQLAEAEALKAAPKLTLSYNKGDPTAEALISVRNDGGPATAVRAYAQLVSVNIDRDANKPTKLEYPLGWVDHGRRRMVPLGSGEVATLGLAENARADLIDTAVRTYYLNLWAAQGEITPVDEEPVNSWIWGADEQTPIRLVLAVRLVTEPPLATPCTREFAVLTRAPYGNIVME